MSNGETIQLITQLQAKVRELMTDLAALKKNNRTAIDSLRQVESDRDQNAADLRISKNAHSVVADRFRKSVEARRQDMVRERSLLQTMVELANHSADVLRQVIEPHADQAIHAVPEELDDDPGSY